MKCIDFHKPEWTHRTLSKYYVKFRDGRKIYVWAWDATDVMDAVDNGTVIEYGTEAYNNDTTRS